MRKEVGISLGIIAAVAIVAVFILTSTGLILHNGSLYKVDPDLRRPIIMTSCGFGAQCDTLCTAIDGSLQGIEVGNKCYTEVFPKE